MIFPKVKIYTDGSKWTGHEAGGWAAQVSAGEALLVQLLGHDLLRQHWPERERDAFEAPAPVVGRSSSVAPAAIEAARAKHDAPAPKVRLPWR